MIGRPARVGIDIARILATILALSACGRADQSLLPTAPDILPPSSAGALSDQLWSTPMGEGWSYLRRTGSRDDDIVAASDAPFGSRDVLQIVFTPDMRPDSEPGVHWIELPRVDAVFAEWWMKLSPNWTPSPAGGGKVTFLWTSDGQGQVYTGLFGPGPHHISVNTEWAPYGQRVWDPNVTRTFIQYDRWYRIGWYAKWPTSPGAGNGTMRWWVNGALNGNYTNVQFPRGGIGFHQFEFAPTLQNPPPREQYMYIGPIRISTW